MNNSTNTTVCSEFEKMPYVIVALISSGTALVSVFACTRVILLVVLFKKYYFFTQRMILYLNIAALLNSNEDDGFGNVWKAFTLVTNRAVGMIHVGSKNNLVCWFMVGLSLLYAAVVSTAGQVWCHPWPHDHETLLLLLWPQVAGIMASSCLHVYSSALSLPREPETLQLLIKLYVERSHSVWKEPEVGGWVCVHMITKSQKGWAAILSCTICRCWLGLKQMQEKS